MSAFAKALGPAFAELPPDLQAFHQGPNPRSFTGHATVTRGTGLLTKIALKLGNFPPAGETPLRVTVSETGSTEIWQRDFGPHRLTSTLKPQAPHIHERLGPFTCTLAPEWDGEKLHIKANRLTLAGLPLPRFLTPESRSFEWEENGAFMFDIAAYHPPGGLLIRYTGALRPCP